MDAETFSKFMQMVKDGALVVVNHSGGKDSQAMTAILRRFVPESQLLVVHAVLSGVEWGGIEEHVRATTQGLEVITCQAGKTFLGMVETTGRWPSSSHRQCTSDLKRDPISKVIRRITTERGISTVINCMGIRAEESSTRAKKNHWRQDNRLSKAGRTVYEFYPIFDMTIDEVWATIRAAGQEPHWAYSNGMTRLSCCFCIMASKSDLRTARELNPELFSQYVEMEKRIGKTMFMKRGEQVSLEAYVA